MKRGMFLLALALGLICSGVVSAAATSADYDMMISIAEDELTEGATGASDFQILMTSRVDETQGWSFGATLETTGAATASLTDIIFPDDYLTVNGGAAPGFATTTIYDAGGAKIEDCATPAGCASVSAASVTQGVVIDLTQVNSLPATENFAMLAGALEAGGGAVGDTVTLAFTSAVGSPPVATVAVNAGASITPDVMESDSITFAEAPECVQPASFTIDAADAAGDTNETVTSLVTVNFNKDGNNADVDIQGWSYGLCVEDTAKAIATAAVIDGTMTADLRGGQGPGFESINVFDEGVTHGVVVDLTAVVVVPSQNDWTDLVVSYEILMTEDDDTTQLRPCDLTLGDPPVANVMVIDGNSIQGSLYEDPAEEKCDTSDAYNTFGTLTKSGIPPAVFLPGNANGDSRLDIADGIFLLSYLWRGGMEPPCLAAADFNGDDTVDTTDAVAMIYWQLQPDIPETPAGGFPAPALGDTCQNYGDQTTLPCNVPQCQ